MLSSGILFAPTTPRAIKHVEAMCFNTTPQDVMEAYVDGCLRLDGWLRGIGGQTQIFDAPDVTIPRRLPCWPNFPGADDVEYRTVSGATDVFRAKPLWKLLANSVESRGIALMTNMAAKELATDLNGQVVGVVAEREGRRIAIEARKGVILTCGSFEYNEAMRDAYLPITPLEPLGHPGNTGDGLVMAQRVGASFWHMSTFYGWPVFKVPENGGTFSINFQAPSFIYVDKDGRRFTDEGSWESHERSKALITYMPNRPNYPHLPIYAIFDDVVRRKAPLVGRVATTSSYDWSLDNSAEVARGWIIRAGTIGELARRIDVDEAILVKTVDRYNENSGAGRDREFGRPRETLAPISTPPYYAIELWPGLATASGGPRRDREARVLGEAGRPVPRLYAAGGLGSIWGFLTLAGGGLTDGMVFGQIAGRNAAAEEPWS